ncbi:hypothetical protein EX895_000542 [Sporisorium graminicola]|uniref:Zn(2)-C6 fungal-type domain-containing protein n=1 Tax=Sporisorium graminicola TaxID=280036 RepID=A0A4U7L037_9BASI|nr:hypothetical protein EX895_000542 [Sporisorium graminicola]TKY90544.1 hypothetical protein EX895_000542 [Sporisorium graminicola]
MSNASSHSPRGSAPNTLADAHLLSQLDSALQSQSSGLTNFNSARRQQHSQDYQSHSDHQHHQPSLHAPWNSTHRANSSPMASQEAVLSHGLPAVDVTQAQMAPSSTSSFDPYSTPSFSFTCLPGLAQPSQENQSYYAHYLDDSNSARHTENLDPALLPPHLSSMHMRSASDALDAFTSAMNASSLPMPLSEYNETGSSSVGSPDSEGDTSQSSDKKKSARRQGVTCDQCRTKHLRCDLDDRRAQAARSASPETAETAMLEMQRSTNTGTAVHHIRCTRCEEKGFVCTKTHAPPSRRYPRPSRSGKRIEQARMLHGASLNQSSLSKPSVERINASTILIRALTELRGAEVRITDRVMAGSLSIQLLNCFFAVCHMQAPVIDFAHFSKTFNLANGDPRKMSIMSNGGSASEGLPSVIPDVQGIGAITWPGSKDSKIGTPGTTETLLAVIHAWAAHYTDAPIAFGPDSKDLDAIDVRLQEVDEHGHIQASFDARDAEGSKPSLKRPKRKQGVACDTCRLRRVRCDVTERPDGMGCSRCEDKRIQCTDTYIQTKRAKMLAKGGKAGHGGSSNDDNTPSADASSEANRLSPLAWIRSQGEGLLRTYRPGDLEHNLRRGRARKAFCHALLNHALSLVHKHDILKKPSVESVQVLSLLAPLLDQVDGIQAHSFADVACDHTEKLGMSTKLVVDETDRNEVEKMLSIMQAHRVFLTTWCRDSIASGLNRRKAFFKEDRAIEVVGQASFRRERVPLSASRQGEVVLSGEMGLTFVIMTMVQIGALSRFLGAHIDAVDGHKPSIPPWQRPAGASMAPIPRAARFAARPSLAELRKLERACGAVWNSLDSLMLFFDRCASKAWSTMHDLQPFRPLGWIASTKLCGSLLYLALFRALGERHRANAAFMATLSHSLGGQSAVSEEDKLVAASLKALFDKSMQRAIVSCRKTARMIGILLPLGILQTGGPILKQIFPVAQFLAKIPSVSDEQVASRMGGGGSGSSQTDHTSVSPSSDPNNFIDPQTLQQQQFVEQFIAEETQRESAAQAAHSIEALNSPSTSAHLDVLRQLEGMHQLNLGPYSHSSKKQEVENLVEGLAQLGYAWDTMDRDIGVIQDLLQSANSAPHAG